MFQGKIIRFNTERGFGFINNDGEDIFFFADSIINRDDFFIKADLDVEFEIAPGFKGPQAINITILEDEPEDESDEPESESDDEPKDEHDEESTE
ncbi:cold shock domain-containing protein [Companilactobacillus allii]|uniref:DNA-binding protein n=1 Tax=Companilactobacillus allii TaxID=1847728 RepID=A0A1P8Q5B4_9LACO|nr:cold shock domain-containing protein [Companilactobacillus allii]APX73043.1 DNA-binding protein [Companilactobacillus allii]USQ67842.1 cold shock domain-containing protein [Companilactobacillus allii]